MYMLHNVICTETYHMLHRNISYVVSCSTSTLHVCQVIKTIHQCPSFSKSLASS